MRRYLGVFEKGEGNWAAYSPDLPGCVSTGQTPEEAEAHMAEALRFHIKGLREEGYEVPKGQSYAQVLTIEEAN